MIWAEVNGIGIRYALERGSSYRAPLVFVHEMGGSIESWDAILPAFEERHRLRFDVRGQGMSERIAGSLDPDDVALDIAALLELSGVRPPVVIVGCAVGGALALNFAAFCPSLAAGAVIFSPAVGVPEDLHRELLATADRLSREGFARRMPGEIDASVDLAFPVALRHDPSAYESFRARQRTIDPRAMAAIFKMLVANTIDDRCDAIRCPTVVVAGSLDQVRPPPRVKTVAAGIRGAEFLVIESGHVPAIQTPHLVIEVLSKFLTTHGL